MLIALPFGLFSAFFVPQMSVTDEDSHFLRSYQVGHGEFVCFKNSAYPQEVIAKSKSSSDGQRGYTNDFSDTINYSDQQMFKCGSAAPYSPVAYMPQAIGMLVAQTIHPTTATMVLFARIANLLFYISALYWIIKRVRVGKYVFFVVALIPQMIHLAASVSADVTNNVVTFGLVAVLLNLFVQKTKLNGKQIIILLSFVAAIALLKRNLLLLILPLIFLPTRLFIRNNIKNIPFNIQKWTLAVVTVLVFAVLYVLWQKISFVAGVPATDVYDPIEHHPNLFLNLLFNTYMSDYGDLVLRGVFGDFSSFLYHFPMILVVVQVVVLLIAFLYDNSKMGRVIAENKWLIISMTATFVLSVFAVTYGLYTEWGLKRGIIQYADGVQGRYFTALLVLLIPLFLWVRKYIAIEAKSEKFIFGLLAVSQIVLLSFYVLYTVKTLMGW